MVQAIPYIIACQTPLYQYTIFNDIGLKIDTVSDGFTIAIEIVQVVRKNSLIN